MNDSVICIGKIYLVQLKVDDEWDGKDLLWAICHTGNDNVNFYFLSVQLGGLLACCYIIAAAAAAAAVSVSAVAATNAAIATLIAFCSTYSIISSIFLLTSTFSTYITRFKIVGQN